MGIPIVDMLREYLATADSPSEGTDLHVGSMLHGVIAPASQVGALTPVFAGIGLAFKQRGELAVALTWVGDGATKTTAFHEGINLASVLHLPVVYVLQNNQVALGTPFERHQAGPFTAWAKAYGVRGFSCDGNNVLDTYAATRQAVDLARGGHGPAIVFAETFRMGGHATHDESEARLVCAPELFEHWGRRDPIGLYEVYLTRHGVPATELEEVERKTIEEIEAAAEQALSSRELNMPGPESLTRRVYAGSGSAPAETSSRPKSRKAGSTRKMRSR
jgi:TPP-dependent pyruvate/acetoin dehydrogenase alpha subunit